MLTDIKLRKEVLEKLRENFTKELDENEAEPSLGILTRVTMT